MSEILSSIDAFAADFAGIMGDIDQVVEKSMNEATKEGLKVGLREVKANASGAGLKRTGRYIAGWSRKLDSGGKKPEGHVYNKTPGLPHLLEKGHATIGGGFVAGRPHIAPAAEVAFDATERKLEEGLDREL